jgi:hypothetical protein
LSRTELWVSPFVHLTDRVVSESAFDSIFTGPSVNAERNTDGA